MSRSLLQLAERRVRRSGDAARPSWVLGHSRYRWRIRVRRPVPSAPGTLSAVSSPGRRRRAIRSSGPSSSLPRSRHAGGGFWLDRHSATGAGRSPHGLRDRAPWRRARHARPSPRSGQRTRPSFPDAAHARAPCAARACAASGSAVPSCRVCSLPGAGTGRSRRWRT